MGEHEEAKRKERSYEEAVREVAQMAEHASGAIMILGATVMAYDTNDDIELARAIGEARGFLVEVMNDDGANG